MFARAACGGHHSENLGSIRAVGGDTGNYRVFRISFGHLLLYTDAVLQKPDAAGPGQAIFDRGQGFQRVEGLGRDQQPVDAARERVDGQGFDPGMKNLSIDFETQTLFFEQGNGFPVAQKQRNLSSMAWQK